MSSVPALAFITKRVPAIASAASRSSSSRSWVRNTILDSGQVWRIRLAASSPFNFGIPMSRTANSGCSSAALRTASSPSDASETLHRGSTCKSFRTSRRHGLKSSTTRTLGPGIRSFYRSVARQFIHLYWSSATSTSAIQNRADGCSLAETRPAILSGPGRPSRSDAVPCHPNKSVEHCNAHSPAYGSSATTAAGKSAIANAKPSQSRPQQL